MDLETSPSNSDSCYDSDQASSSATLSSTMAIHSKKSLDTPSLSSDKRDDIVTNEIKVNLIYDEVEFPKIIQAGDFSEFYAKVFSALSNKKSGCEPCHLQYQVVFRAGVKWYNFNKDTGFEDLCMDKNNPEIFIKATSTPMDSLLGIVHSSNP